MAKAYFGAQEVKKCYFGTNEVDKAFMGTVAVCETGPKPHDFEMLVTASAKPTWRDTKTIDNKDGTWTVYSDDPLFHRLYLEIKYGDNNITKVKGIKTDTITDWGSSFHTMNKLLEVSNLDTSNGTNFYQMFNGSELIKSIPSIDTSKGTDFTNMFFGCLELICISDLDTRKQTTTTLMFNDASKLTAPNKAEQTALLAGSLYHNPNPCPGVAPGHVDDFDATDTLKGHVEMTWTNPTP